MSNNRDKKKIFTQRARLGQGGKEDSSKLSIGRFANERNQVYVSKKKIELHNREKNFKTKYDKFSKKENNNSNISDIYKQYEDNDPMSRFGTGDDSKYEKIEKRNNKRNNNRNNKNSKNNDQDSENENEEESDNENEKPKKEIKKTTATTTTTRTTNTPIINDKNSNEETNKGEEDSEDKTTAIQPSVPKQFRNAKIQFEKEKREKQELFKAIAEKKEKTKKHLQEKNKEKFGTILKKTKRGQPIMSNQINKLLSKIQSQ